MKDIIITSKKLKQERNIFLLSFLLAFIINVIAIIIYSRPWIEIISQIVYVIVNELFRQFSFKKRKSLIFFFGKGDSRISGFLGESIR